MIGKSKKRIAAVACAALLASVVGTVSAHQTDQGTGGWYMGPGMMGGWNMGPGMMGPGMMQGRGMGPGMMGPGGMGPGMMGPGGMGPGMMGPGMMGPGGMGPGMMGPGGMGPGMMGPGAMGGYCPACGMRLGSGEYFGIELTENQRAKIARIEKKAREQQWDLMSQMREAQFKLQELYYADRRDSSAINAQMRKIEQLQQQMFEANIDAQSQVEAVLTPEQRKRMERLSRSQMWGY